MHLLQPEPEEVFGSLQRRMDYVHSIRERVRQEKERVKDLHRSGASGREVTRLLSIFADETVKEVFSLAVRHHGFSPDDVDLPLALVAVGGYGRSELCPYSDVDLLFLRLPSLKPLEGMVNEVLTLLWDSGFRVGHSVRTVAECVRVASKDLSARTAMLEGRYLVGSLKLFGDFKVDFRKRAVERVVDTFVRQKVKERERRYRHFEHLVTLMEPNVKEGVGGLRDYHVAMWAAAARFGFSTIDECLAAGLVDMDLYEAVRAAYDFILRVRNELHYLVGAKEDVLAVEVQRSVAANLGYQDVGHRLAVERFMHDYYIQAFVIRQFSEVMLSRCQPTKKGLTKVLERVKSRDLGDGFTTSKEELRLGKGALGGVHLDPLLMLRAFELCQEHDLVLHESLRSAIRQQLDTIDEDCRREPGIRKRFYSILSRHGASRVLRLMHEVGFLGALMPEFGGLALLPQYDVFHRYTADEHTLKALQYVEELADTTTASLQELKSVYLGLENHLVIKMAVLMHDIGKSGGAAGHVERGVDITRTVLDRWPMEEKATQQILLLTANHLLMNRVAQRRDMHDEKTIKEFCDVVESLENLELLYLLTYADLKAVGPEVWTEWKGALLLELYNRAKDFMTREPGERLTGDALVEHLREVVTRELAQDVAPEAIEAYFEAMPYKYIASTSPDRIVRHIRLGEKMVAQGGLAMEHWHNHQFDYTEVLVCTTGRTGIFSEIAGTLSSKNLNILGAQIYTRRDNIAIDTLQVDLLEGGCVTDEAVWQTVEQNLRDVIAGTETVEALLARRKRYVMDKRFVGPPVEAKVTVNNKISDTHTVIEMKAHDRLGLLYLVTRTMVDFQLDIYLAKISTEANRAVNVFYVTDLSGEKILDAAFIARLRESLLEVLTKGEIA